MKNLSKMGCMAAIMLACSPAVKAQDEVETTIAAENINPSSSPITENIKSVVFGYR